MASGKNIFLSYHSSRLELIQHLAKYLERNGLTAWYAQRDIKAGEVWDNAIHDAIKNCKAVVLLFCSKADSSIQIKRELALADKYKKPVFWLKVERVEPNRLSYFLTSTQWLDWMDLRDVTLERLVKDISSIKDSGLFSEIDGENDEDISINPDNETFANQVSNNSGIKGVFAFNNEREAAESVARIYFDIASNNPDSSIILPTGRSATAVFRAMMRIVDEIEGCPFGEAHLISDTETFGVWSAHETSRTRHIYEQLIEPLKEVDKALGDRQLHLLSGVYTDKDPIKAAQKLIRDYPPSIHAVSVSPVGEILAYEVGTYNEIEEIIDDAPRVVEVGEHSKKYIDPNQPSKSIITIGLGTAMASKLLLILAFDIQKAVIVRRLLTETMTAGIPATLLKKHPNAYLITTKSVVKEAEVEDMAIVGITPKEALECITKH